MSAWNFLCVFSIVLYFLCVLSIVLYFLCVFSLVTIDFSQL